MTSLLSACTFFIAIHVLISGSPLRDKIVTRLGERLYLTLFSLLSIAGMIWLVRAYTTTDTTLLWNPPLILRWLAPALVLIAFVFVVAGLTTPSPTTVGGESQLDRADPAQGMLRVTRHPFLWGVALWALTHLLVNGNTAALVLFASLLLLALIGPLLIDGKRQRAYGTKWQRFAAVTSNVPFLAILSSRNTLRIAEIGPWRIGGGIAAWAAMVAAHPWLFGGSALP